MPNIFVISSNNSLSFENMSATSESVHIKSNEGSRQKNNAMINDEFYKFKSKDSKHSGQCNATKRSLEDTNKKRSVDASFENGMPLSDDCAASMNDENQVIVDFSLESERIAHERQEVKMKEQFFLTTPLEDLGRDVSSAPSE